MAWPAIAAAAVSIGSSLLGSGSAMSAASDERDAIRAQAKLTYQQRVEEIRRSKIEQQKVLGYNRAAVGASNLQMSGSPQRSINKLQEQFAQDIKWREKAAVKERKAIRSGAPGGTANFAAGARAAGSIANTVMGAWG